MGRRFILKATVLLISLGLVSITIQMMDVGWITDNFTYGETVENLFGNPSHVYRTHQRLLKAKYKSRFQGTFPVVVPNKSLGQPWDFHNLLSGINISPVCSSKVFLLVLITSTPDHFDRRRAIRNSWCQPAFTGIEGVSSMPNVPLVKCAFLVGRDVRERVRNKVAQEAELHSDILYGAYNDTYKNLTFKVLTGLHWAAQKCIAKFLFKTDDDCFLNTITIVHFLQSELKKYKVENLYAGRIASTKETQVIRDPSSPWAVSQEDFLPDTFPQYTSGSGYLLSWDVVVKLHEESKWYKPFPNEDAYIGVLAELVGVRPQHSERFRFFKKQWRMCNFLYLFVVHEVEPENQEYMQDLAVKAFRNCKERMITVL